MYPRGSTLPASFSVGVSGDAIAAGALMGSTDTWYSVLGGLLPETCMTMATAARAGDVARVQVLNVAPAPIWSLLSDIQV